MKNGIEKIGAYHCAGKRDEHMGSTRKGESNP